MKVKIFLTALVIFTLCPEPCALSQIPQGFNYQAVARDPSTGDAIPNATIDVKLGILSDTTTPVIVREELFSTVRTDRFGIFTLIIGTGTYQAGSVTNFSDIDWSAKPLFLRVRVFHSGLWKYMGSAKLWSVPYSMVAKDIDGTIDKLKVTGTETSMDSALFEVKNRTGQTVFAVYNEGVRIYVDDGAKSTKGGFAIGGFGTAAYKGPNSQKYFFISKDSIRMYLDNLPGKAVKGGFAIGGFDKSKGFSSYLNVTPDSTRIFTADTLKGFGVGNISTGVAQSYLKMTPSNYFIGHEAGGKITTGKFNSVIGYKAGSSLLGGTANDLMGYQAGASLTTGAQNSFIGYMSGSRTTSGTSNVFIGYRTGFNNAATLGGGEATANVFIGSEAGFSNTTGAQNTFIGLMAGYAATTTWRNTFVGFQAGNKTNANYNTLIGCQTGGDLRSTAVGNTFVGYHAGVTTDNGTYNVCIGMKAGGATDSQGPNELGTGNVYLGALAGHKHQGDNNVIIGYQAGGQVINSSTPVNGSGNIFIGYQAGWNELSSNKLYIDNSNTSTPLIYGDFTDGSEKLVMNGFVGINIAPVHLIHLSGGAYSDGAAWTNASDLNLKENFEIVNGEKILGLINELPVTRWNYKADNPGVKHIGPVAQDFYSLFGLGNDDKSISSVDPSGIALAGIKELSRQNGLMKIQIDSYKAENEDLKNRIQSLQEKVDQIESLLVRDGLR